MLPLGTSSTVTLAIFSFMWRWNDYILPLLVLSDQKKYTIQIAIKNYIGFNGVDWSSILSASVMSIIPIIILFIILQRYIVGGLSASGVKGKTAAMTKQQLQLLFRVLFRYSTKAGMLRC
jgi:alpha-1,4-digalacturonate transport system permease protein